MHKKISLWFIQKTGSKLQFPFGLPRLKITVQTTLKMREQQRYIYSECDATPNLKVRLRSVTAILVLSCIIHSVLCNLAQRPPLLSEVAHHPDAAPLRTLNARLQCKHQIGSTRTNVSAKHVRPIALIVHSLHKHTPQKHTVRQRS